MVIRGTTRVRRRSRWTPPGPARSFLSPGRGVADRPLGGLVGVWGGVSDLLCGTLGRGAIAHIKLTRCRRGVSRPTSETCAVTPVTCRSPCCGCDLFVKGTRRRAADVERTACPRVPRGGRVNPGGRSRRGVALVLGGRLGAVLAVLGGLHGQAQELVADRTVVREMAIGESGGQMGTEQSTCFVSNGRRHTPPPGARAVGGPWFVGTGGK